MPAPLKITGSARYGRVKKKLAMPLLPGDTGLLRQIEKQREELRQNKSTNEPLEYTGPLRNFRPPELVNSTSMEISEIVSSIIDHMWCDFPRNDKGGFNLKDTIVAETAEFREGVPRAVAITHIYGLFPTRTTQVDRAISEGSLAGTIRIIPINAPDGSLDLVMLASEFYKVVDTLYPEFAAFCRQKPDSVWLNANELREAGVDIGLAVSHGLLVVDPGKPGIHNLSFPNQGRLLKLIRQCRMWLLKTMVQNNRKFKEMPESQIKEKLETTKKYWTQFRGVTLEWILYDAIGGGYVDGFMTPMGRGWKVLKS